MTLTWAESAAGGSPSSYTVIAALSPGGVAVASVPIAAHALVVPNVRNGVYYVRVFAANSDGVSAPSNEVVVVVSAGAAPPRDCNAPPTPPQNLTASALESVVRLTWLPSATGCAANSFTVQAGSGPGLSNIAVVNLGSVTSLSSAAPAGTYYVRVIALNAFGGSSPSNEVAVTVGAVAPALPLAGSIWLAHIEPNIFPWWNACPGAQLFLAPDIRLGFRCSSAELFSYADHVWAAANGTLSIRFENGTIAYDLPIPAAPDRAISGARVGFGFPTLFMERILMSSSPSDGAPRPQ